MRKTGSMVYVPKIVLDELESVKSTLDEKKTSIAFREMAKFSKIGREVERINNNLFNSLSLGVYPLRRKKR